MAGAIAVDSEERRKRIAERAYFKAEQRGFDEGHELDDWLEAEQEITALIADEQSGSTDDPRPAQPDQTSGTPVPAPLGKEEQIRAEEVKQSAEELTAATREAPVQRKAPARGGREKHKTNKVRGDPAQLRRTA
jgi:hypothetical protein